MLKINEAPHIVLHAIHKANAKEFSRHFSAPIRFFFTGTVTVGQSPHKTTLKEKNELHEFLNAIHKLVIKDPRNIGVEDVKNQTQETLQVLNNALNYAQLLPYSNYLFTARDEIEFKKSYDRIIDDANSADPRGATIHFSA